MELICTHCRKPFIKTSRREDALDRLLSMAYSYPFRCQICQHRFHILQWGLHYNDTQVDRREYQRRSVRTSTTVLDEQGHTLGVGTVIDLSMGGCSIETTASLPVGSMLQLKIEAFDEQPVITVENAIVRTARASASSDTGVGVEFLRFGSDESRLSDYMQSLWMEGTQEARKGRWLQPYA